MLTTEDRIEQIEEEIRKTPYHKGTEHYIGKLKASIARLRREQLERDLKKVKSSGGGFGIKKTGDATVVLVGPPSVGKSTLINKLTKAESKVASYDFTTISVIPGMLDYKGAKIQVFDLPGIISGAASGRGRGRQVLSVARNADLVLVMVDVKTINLIPSIFKELFEAALRINKQKPAVTVIKGSSGGIKVNAATKLSLDYNTVRSLAEEFRLVNTEIIIKKDLSLDQLVDAFAANCVYLPCLLVINKTDLGVPEHWQEFLPSGIESVLICSKNNDNLDLLKEKIWEKLEFIRVYLKKNEKIDFEKPVIAKKERKLVEILEDLQICDKKSFKSAKVFGPGAKYPGQEVSLSFVPRDGSIIQFV